MKKIESEAAIRLRLEGLSINEIARKLGVAKSSVSVWVRHVELSDQQKSYLAEKGFYREAVERRRKARLINESRKRETVISAAQEEIQKIDSIQLRLMGTMLYWAEGGKTQRMVRFSNGDPEMIKIMVTFFREICHVPEAKFRGYIHIHPTLDPVAAEAYWSSVSAIPLSQFFKTYTKPNKASQSKKHTLPYGTFDIYVMDTSLFLKITGWARAIFSLY